MKKLIALVAVIALLTIALLAPATGVAQEGYTPAEIETVQLIYTDSLVYGYGEYIDDRGVVAEWEAPNDVAVIGSHLYVEIAIIWRPVWHEGRVSADVELSTANEGPDRTVNKVDLTAVLGIEPGVPTTSGSHMFTWGNLVEDNTLMFPAGTAVILEQGEKLYLIADGMNHIMSANNAVAMYFRAYIYYVNLN